MLTEGIYGRFLWALSTTRLSHAPRPDKVFFGVRACACEFAYAEGPAVTLFAATFAYAEGPSCSLAPSRRRRCSGGCASGCASGLQGSGAVRSTARSRGTRRAVPRDWTWSVLSVKGSILNFLVPAVPGAGGTVPLEHRAFKILLDTQSGYTLGNLPGAGHVGTHWLEPCPPLWFPDVCAGVRREGPGRRKPADPPLWGYRPPRGRANIAFLVTSGCFFGHVRGNQVQGPPISPRVPPVWWVQFVAPRRTSSTPEELR